MRFTVEWIRTVDDRGDPCGPVSADEDTVFDALDTLESLLSGLGYRMAFTRREIVVPDGRQGDAFLFGGTGLEELLGLEEGAIRKITPDLLLRGALAAVELERCGDG